MGYENWDTLGLTSKNTPHFPPPNLFPWRHFWAVVGANSLGSSTYGMVTLAQICSIFLHCRRAKFEIYIKGKFLFWLQIFSIEVTLKFGASTAAEVCCAFCKCDHTIIVVVWFANQPQTKKWKFYVVLFLLPFFLSLVSLSCYHHAWCPSNVYGRKIVKRGTTFNNSQKIFKGNNVLTIFAHCISALEKLSVLFATTNLSFFEVSSQLPFRTPPSRPTQACSVLHCFFFCRKQYVSHIRNTWYSFYVCSNGNIGL